MRLRGTWGEGIGPSGHAMAQFRPILFANLRKRRSLRTCWRCAQLIRPVLVVHDRDRWFLLAFLPAALALTDAGAV